MFEEVSFLMLANNVLHNLPIICTRAHFSSAGLCVCMWVHRCVHTYILVVPPYSGSWLIPKAWDVKTIV